MPDQHITHHLIDVVAGVGVLVELVLLDDELVADHAAVVDDHVRHRLDAAVHDDEVVRRRQRRPTRLVQRTSQQTRLRGLHERGSINDVRKVFWAFFPSFPYFYIAVKLPALRCGIHSGFLISCVVVN